MQVACQVKWNRIVQKMLNFFIFGPFLFKKSTIERSAAYYLLRERENSCQEIGESDEKQSEGSFVAETALCEPANYQKKNSSPHDKIVRKLDGGHRVLVDQLSFSFGFEEDDERVKIQNGPLNLEPFHQEDLHLYRFVFENLENGVLDVDSRHSGFPPTPIIIFLF
jgi:hypothetical protein